MNIWHNTKHYGDMKTIHACIDENKITDITLNVSQPHIITIHILNDEVYEQWNKYVVNISMDCNMTIKHWVYNKFFKGKIKRSETITLNGIRKLIEKHNKQCVATS